VDKWSYQSPLAVSILYGSRRRPEGPAVGGGGCLLAAQPGLYTVCHWIPPAGGSSQEQRERSFCGQQAEQLASGVSGLLRGLRSLVPHIGCLLGGRAGQRISTVRSVPSVSHAVDAQSLGWLVPSKSRAQRGGLPVITGPSHIPTGASAAFMHKLQEAAHGGSLVLVGGSSVGTSRRRNMKL